MDVAKDEQKTVHSSGRLAMSKQKVVRFLVHGYQVPNRSSVVYLELLQRDGSTDIDNLVSPRMDTGIATGGQVFN
jgi:hypothetical protein